MGKIVKDRIIYGGIDSALQNKVGSAPLDTVAQDLSGAVNELKASGGGTITDVHGVADIDLTGKADAATTLSGYGITDANINNGTITLGSNTITPLTSHQDISGKVNKAGDTMTGSLTISNSLLGSCILKNNSYTINTSSNNGVSSFTGNNFEMQDSASTISTKFGNYLSSDGSVEAIISAHNKKTDGTAISNSLEIKIAKDGTKSYAVSDPAAFRSAIGAGQANTIATGDSNGQIKVTPSSGSAYNVSVKGLGSAAYLDANTAESNSTVVQRTSSGYVYANYFHTTCAAANPSSYTNSRALFTSDDGFIRRSTAANFRTMLGLGSLATLSSISDYISVGSVSYDNLSISANNSAQTGNVATTKSGWTALGIIGVSLTNASSSGTLYSWCSVYQYAMNSSKQVYAQVRNHYTGGAAKIKVQWFILYIK